MNGIQVLCIQENLQTLSVTRIQIVVSVRLGEWAWLVMSLHSGAVAWLRFTEQQKQSASEIGIH